MLRSSEMMSRMLGLWAEADPAANKRKQKVTTRAKVYLRFFTVHLCQNDSAEKHISQVVKRQATQQSIQESPQAEAESQRRLELVESATGSRFIYLHSGSGDRIRMGDNCTGTSLPRRFVQGIDLSFHKELSEPGMQWQCTFPVTQSYESF